MIPLPNNRFLKLFYKSSSLREMSSSKRGVSRIMEFNGVLRLLMACLGWLNTRLHNLYQRGSYQNHQWANLFHFLETNIRTTGCWTAAWKNQNKCSCRQGVVWICHTRKSRVLSKPKAACVKTTFPCVHENALHEKNKQRLQRRFKFKCK